MAEKLSDRDRIRFNNRTSYLNHRQERIQKQNEYCFRNKEAIKQRVFIRYEVCPWLKTYQSIWSRIYNKKNKSYKFYGGRGIKCLITRHELEVLWYRDKADTMQWPTIDRINNDGHYEINNCRYVEHNNNKKTIKSDCIRGHVKGYRGHCKECRRIDALTRYHRNKVNHV